MPTPTGPGERGTGGYSRQYTENVEVNGDRRDFVVTFLVSVQESMMSAFNDMCWDECLRRAHQAGHVPIGPILISKEEHQPPQRQQRPLVEGEPLGLPTLPAAMQGMVGFLGGTGVLLKITTRVELGTSLTGPEHIDAADSGSLISDDIDPTGLSPDDVAWLEGL